MQKAKMEHDHNITQSIVENALDLHKLTTLERGVQNINPNESPYQNIGAYQYQQ
jgi:hypothetical protein